jgi:hypothetical protein
VASDPNSLSCSIVTRYGLEGPAGLIRPTRVTFCDLVDLGAAADGLYDGGPAPARARDLVGAGREARIRRRASGIWADMGAS